MHLDGELLDEVGKVRGGHLGQAPVKHSDVGSQRPSAAGAASSLAPRLGPTTAQQSLGVSVLAIEQVGDVRDPFAQRLGVDASLKVVGDLDGTSTGGLVDGLRHRRGHLVGIHVHFTGDVARGTTDGLDQASC